MKGNQERTSRSIIAASVVFARHFGAFHAPGWATFSTLTGVTYLAAIVALIATAGMAWASIFFYVAVALGWVWLSALALRMRARGEGLHLEMQQQ
ncbi:MAG: hypothetical protein J2P37_15405 [Ktedonobacteraceae bacterium]|nr:hypothetical protein [Ktedonobacteraceae bacterium]